MSGRRLIVLCSSPNVGLNIVAATPSHHPTAGHPNLDGGPLPLAFPPLLRIFVDKIPCDLRHKSQTNQRLPSGVPRNALNPVSRLRRGFALCPGVALIGRADSATQNDTNYIGSCDLRSIPVDFSLFLHLFLPGPFLSITWLALS
jgi:hypothetical protein